VGESTGGSGCSSAGSTCSSSIGMYSGYTGSGNPSYSYTITWGTPPLDTSSLVPQKTLPVTVALPSSSVDRRDEILKSERPPRKRSCLFAIGSRYEAGESSTTRPTEGQGTDYGFVSTVDFEARRQGIRDVGYGIRDTWIDLAEAVPAIAPTTVKEVNTRVVELAELHEHDIPCPSGGCPEWDMRQELSDMQKELISQREQLRRERQPGPDARFPDHQEVTGDTDILRCFMYKFSKLYMKWMKQIMVRTRRGQTPPPTNPNNITLEAVQTMIDQALLRNFGVGDGSYSSHAENPRNMHTARLCYYADFMKCHPLNFKGTESAVGLTRWIEKMESVFNISGCAVENQVKLMRLRRWI
nr:hypothetical protein [Tanacetum cinerariifolium]